jgi:hypothetical protein
MAVTYPDGMTPELADRLYHHVKVSWASDAFVYDESRSECRHWLEQGAATGQYPRLVNVIRRGEDNAVRVFQYGNGMIFEQET